MRTNRLQRLALAALLAASSLAAQAATSYDLRALQFEAGFAPGTAPPDPSPLQFRDWFNNSTPLTGATFTTGAGVTTAASYSVFNNGFSPGSETTPGDVSANGTPVGQLRLAPGDAKPSPSATDPAGFTTAANRITVESHALNRTQSWEARAVWNMATPDGGDPTSFSYYGLRISDNPGNNGAYDDALDLRVTYDASGPRLNLRRLTFDGTNLTSTGYGFRLVADMLPAGKTLADVGFIGMEFHYNYYGDGPGLGTGVLAAFFLLDKDTQDLAQFRFLNGDGSPRIFSIFNGEDFTRVSAGAVWTQPLAAPIPEPGSYALMALGLAAVGFAARRRRAWTRLSFSRRAASGIPAPRARAARGI